MLNYAPIDRIMAEVDASGMMSSINIIRQASGLRHQNTLFIIYKGDNNDKSNSHERRRHHPHERW